MSFINIEILNQQITNTSILYINDEYCIISTKNKINDINYIIEQEQYPEKKYNNIKNEIVQKEIIEIVNFFEKKTCQTEKFSQFTDGYTSLYLCKKHREQVDQIDHSKFYVTLINGQYEIINKKILIGIDSRLIKIDDNTFIVYVYHTLTACENHTSFKRINETISALFFVEIRDYNLLIFNVAPLNFYNDCYTKNIMFNYNNATHNLLCLDVFNLIKFNIDLTSLLKLNMDERNNIYENLCLPLSQNYNNSELEAPDIAKFRPFYIQKRFVLLLLLYYGNINKNYKHIKIHKTIDDKETDDKHIYVNIENINNSINLIKEKYSGSYLGSNKIALIHNKIINFDIDTIFLQKFTRDTGLYTYGLMPGFKIKTINIEKTDIDNLEFLNKFLNIDNFRKSIKNKNILYTDQLSIQYDNISTLNLKTLPQFLLLLTAIKYENKHFVKLFTNPAIQLDYSNYDELQLLLLLICYPYIVLINEKQYFRSNYGQYIIDKIKKIYPNKHEVTNIYGYINYFTLFNPEISEFNKISKPFLIGDCSTSGISFFTHIDNMDENNIYFSGGIDDTVARQYVMNKELIDEYMSLPSNLCDLYVLNKNKFYDLCSENDDNFSVYLENFELYKLFITYKINLENEKINSIIDMIIEKYVVPIAKIFYFMNPEIEEKYNKLKNMFNEEFDELLKKNLLYYKFLKITTGGMSKINYKNKYIKYKHKYIELKKNIVN